MQRQESKQDKLIRIFKFLGLGDDQVNNLNNLGIFEVLNENLKDIKTVAGSKSDEVTIIFNIK